MITRPQHPEHAAREKPIAPGALGEPRRDGFAVSPAIGPIPAIYVPPLEQTQPPEPARSIGGTMPDIPADLRYSADHLWARAAPSGVVRVGVTDFAQQSL